VPTRNIAPTPPAIRGQAGVRCVVLVAGLLLFALGIVLILESQLGLSPWDALNQGVTEHTALSFGAANTIVSLAVLAVAWRLGARVGPGTIANAVLIGVFVDVLLDIDAIAGLAESPLAARAALLVGGVLLIAAGSALYIGAALGAGPRDSLMLVVSRRTTRRIGLVRAIIESSVTVAGFALGGTVGIGTLFFALAIGPALEAAFWLLQSSPFAEPAPAPACS
jgi:uncharacterized membrane protein YczE